MAEISVKIEEVRKDNYILPSLISRLDNCERAVAVLRWRIQTGMKDAGRIKDELRIICQEIEKLKEKMETLYKVTDLCMNQYADTEALLNRRAGDFR